MQAYAVSPWLVTVVDPVVMARGTFTPGAPHRPNRNLVAIPEQGPPEALELGLELGNLSTMPGDTR